MFTGFWPAVSKDALKRMSEEIRSWRIHRAPPRNCKTSPGVSTLSSGVDDLLRQVPHITVAVSR